MRYDCSCTTDAMGFIDEIAFLATLGSRAQPFRCFSIVRDPFTKIKNDELESMTGVVTEA